MACRSGGRRRAQGSLSLSLCLSVCLCLSLSVRARSRVAVSLTPRVSLSPGLIADPAARDLLRTRRRVLPPPLYVDYRVRSTWLNTSLACVLQVTEDGVCTEAVEGGMYPAAVPWRPARAFKVVSGARTRTCTRTRTHARAHTHTQSRSFG